MTLLKEVCHFDVSKDSCHPNILRLGTNCEPSAFPATMPSLHHHGLQLSETMKRFLLSHHGHGFVIAIEIPRAIKMLIIEETILKFEDSKICFIFFQV